MNLPFSRADVGKLRIDVFWDSDVPVDQYSFDLTSPGVEWKSHQDAVFSWSEKGGIRIWESEKIKVELTGPELVISDKNGNEIVKGFPGLMLIPLNGEGSGVQMTKETPGFEIFSPCAGNRKIIETFTK